MLVRFASAVVALFLSCGVAFATCPTSCFWIGGTGTLDLLTDTLHWSASTGGASCTPCEPGSTSILNFDGASGGGTVTVTVAGGTMTVGGLVWGAFTGTLDFATSDNNVTLTAVNGFNGSGTGSGRVINLGDGTWTLTGAGAAWSMAVITGLSSFNANASTIVGTSSSVTLRTWNLGAGLTYNDITISANSGGGVLRFQGTPTVTHLSVVAPNYVMFTGGSTFTISNAFTWTGDATNQIGMLSDSSGSKATISVATGTPTCAWCGIHDMAFTGGATFSATNSFDLGDNTGITITRPVVGGGSGGGIIGG